jgi:hypothetical protein
LSKTRLHAEAFLKRDPFSGLEPLPTERYSFIVNGQSDPRWGVDSEIGVIDALNTLLAVYPGQRIQIFDRRKRELSCDLTDILTKRFRQEGLA